MPSRDRTSLGGSIESFQTTNWTQIVNTRTEDESHRREILNELIARYWKPVYCYLRSRRYDNERAKDMTQGFLQDVVLRRELIQHADPAKGKFRTFLLTALDRYVVSVRRVETAKKRLPTSGLISMEDLVKDGVPEPVGASVPEDAFNYAWASDVLDRVLAEVKRECEQDGKAIHWAAFRVRLLRPIMESTDPPPLSQVCTDLGIADEAKASNMVITVKRRFQATLKRHMRQFVESDDQVGDEIQDLINILGWSSLKHVDRKPDACVALANSRFHVNRTARGDRGHRAAYFCDAPCIGQDATCGTSCGVYEQCASVPYSDNELHI